MSAEPLAEHSESKESDARGLYLAWYCQGDSALAAVSVGLQAQQTDAQLDASPVALKTAVFHLSWIPKQAHLATFF